jgi:hypothetical protein
MVGTITTDIAEDTKLSTRNDQAPLQASTVQQIVSRRWENREILHTSEHEILIWNQLFQQLQIRSVNLEF